MVNVPVINLYLNSKYFLPLKVCSYNYNVVLMLSYWITCSDDTNFHTKYEKKKGPPNRKFQLIWGYTEINISWTNNTTLNTCMSITPCMILLDLTYKKFHWIKKTREFLEICQLSQACPIYLETCITQLRINLHGYLNCIPTKKYNSLLNNLS